VLATLLVYVAARLLGACRGGALVAGALSALVPYSARLGIAAVPEVPCAALTLFGAATLASADAKTRALGGVALSAACLSRYEAWPVAGVFAGIGLCDTRKNRALLASAALALLGPTVWLLVGRVEHGSALFFVSRVTSYRRALGPAATGPLALRLLQYPGLLLRAEPELGALVLVVAALFSRFGDRETSRPYVRTGLALLALLVFLMFGSVRDGVPTHHAARVLLPLWFFGCVLAGHGLAHVAARATGRARASALALVAVATLCGWLARPVLMPAEGFAERQLELETGNAAKRLHASVLAVDTPDYGYFAVQAAFGSPTRSVPLADHDPRHPPELDPFADTEGLGPVLRRHGAHFLAATTEHATRARDCTKLWSNAAFALLECPNGAPAVVYPP
jgi:hypothetical protein